MIIEIDNIDIYVKNYIRNIKRCKKILRSYIGFFDWYFLSYHIKRDLIDSLWRKLSSSSEKVTFLNEKELEDLQKRIDKVIL